jgi:phospholipid-translocating ATPase
MRPAILYATDKIHFLERFLRFTKIYDVDIIREKERTIYISNEKPNEHNEAGGFKITHANNRIKTSKYNLITFVPKNLLEQFRRITNLYYIINAIILFFIPDPPTSPILNILPSLFIALITALKKGYEDILRHRADRIINNLPVKILRNGTFKKLKWRDIKCGDIVQVNAETQLPCDLVLLHSDMKDGICYITTANLDGETNLKRRLVPSKFPKLKTESDFSNLRGVIKCDLPNLRLYEFNGKIIVNEQQYPIVNENILLRGSTLKIAPVIYGCAIYTGQETKMMLNSKFKLNKFSCVETKLNLYTIIFLILLCILSFIVFIASLSYNHLFKSHWYLDGREPAYFTTNINLYRFIILITIMNLFNYIIPLATYVTLEILRLVGVKFIEWDLEMYDESTNQPAKANTSDLNEDLGQIEYLFSDKTGTLTENEMEFKQFSINGNIYEERNGEIYQIGSSDNIDILQVCKYILK